MRTGKNGGGKAFQVMRVRNTAIEAKANKGIFRSYMKSPKEWKRRLDDLEPIRNAIMHCRGQYLAEERISRPKESCFELQKLVQKVKG